MAHEVRWVDDRVELTFRGRVSTEDARATDHAVFGSSRFDAVTGILVDVSQVAEVDMTPGNAVENAFIDNVARHFKEHCKVAYVVTGEAARQHLRVHNGTLERLGFPWIVRHFDGREQALAWLCSDGKDAARP